MPPFLLSPWVTQTRLLRGAFPKHSKSSLSPFRSASSFCPMPLIAPAAWVITSSVPCIFSQGGTSPCVDVALLHSSSCTSQSPVLGLSRSWCSEVPTGLKTTTEGHWAVPCSFNLLLLLSHVQGRLSPPWTSGHVGKLTHTHSIVYKIQSFTARSISPGHVSKWCKTFVLSGRRAWYPPTSQGSQDASELGKLEVAPWLACTWWWG